MTGLTSEQRRLVAVLILNGGRMDLRTLYKALHWTSTSSGRASDGDFYHALSKLEEYDILSTEYTQTGRAYIRVDDD